jgi:hypothetical protein
MGLTSMSTGSHARFTERRKKKNVQISLTFCLLGPNNVVVARCWRHFPSNRHKTQSWLCVIYLDMYEYFSFLSVWVGRSYSSGSRSKLCTLLAVPFVATIHTKRKKGSLNTQRCTQQPSSSVTAVHGVTCTSARYNAQHSSHDYNSTEQDRQRKGETPRTSEVKKSACRMNDELAFDISSPPQQKMYEWWFDPWLAPFVMQ